MYQIDVEIINDNQWEPDEEFFLKLSLLLNSEQRQGVQLGRISIMEITILNDDGRCSFLLLWNCYESVFFMSTVHYCLEGIIEGTSETCMFYLE